tara:strand:- start:20 stop:337 length:318 start_codon:yes stop_codon:yes gene_type:complete
VLKIIVLIPLILSLLWFGYLQANKYTLEQGKQGFLYIFVLSGVIAAFYTLMLFLTRTNALQINSQSLCCKKKPASMKEAGFLVFAGVTVSRSDSFYAAVLIASVR